MTMRPKIILDCDPGLDDAVALVLAAQNADLIGVTTVGGNAPLADVTTNALLTCQLFDIDVEVHSGAARPLVAPPRHAPDIHGEGGFSGATLPDLTRAAASADAVGYLIESARRIDDLWIVATGPLTNVATAFNQAPDIINRLAGVSWMGGSATVGNNTPVAEFNAFVDPEAVSVVFTAGLKQLYMSGLDLTHQFVVDDSLAADVGAIGTDGAIVISQLMDHYLQVMEALAGRRWGALHDPCAVLALTHPEVIRHAGRHVAVELDGTLTRGMTVVDRRGYTHGLPVNTQWCHTVDLQAARRAVVSAIAARADHPGGART